MSRVAQALLTRELRAIYSKYTNEISTPGLLASLKSDLTEFAAALRLEGALDPDTFRELPEHIDVEKVGDALYVRFSPQLQAALLGHAEEPSSGSPRTSPARLREPPKFDSPRALRPGCPSTPTPKASIGKRAANMPTEEPSDT